MRHRGAIGYRRRASGKGWSVAILMLGMVLAAGGRFASAATADAPASPTERELRIERTLACPQCTDLPLDVCDRDICVDMRSIVHQKVATGESDAAIRQYFVDRYGARVLLAPAKGAGGLFVWILPFAALLLGGALTFAFTRAARVRMQALTSADADRFTTGRYRTLVERDIQELE